jgi:hypothetical protein
MADERDPQVSKAYRELGAEEPPRALDEAILAASRRAAGRRRWYIPVAAAAIITLAVAVTVQVERQKPDEEVVVATVPPQAQEERREQQTFSAPAVPQSKPAQKPARQPQATDELRDLAKSNEQGSAAAGARADQAPGAPPVVAQSAPPPEPAREEMESPRPQASMAARGRLESKVRETPEAALERIAELRKRGKHDEADKALLEFRKQYPDYRMSDETKAKIEKK